MIMEDWGFDKVCKYLDEQLERLKEHEAQEQQQLDDFISMELTGEEIVLCKEVIENKREEERLETKRIKIEESIAESVFDLVEVMNTAYAKHFLRSLMRQLPVDE